VFAEALSARIGRPVVVENKPGAGTMIGANYVATAKPDGYTLLMASADSLTTGIAIRRKPPFNPLSSFTPIGLLTLSPMVISVNPKVPAGDLRALIANSKGAAQPLRYGHGGVGTIMHLTGEMLAQQADAPFQQIPYRGGAPAVADAIGGQIEMVIVGPTSVQSQIEAGQLRGIAQTGSERHPLLQKVPTTTEAGLPNLRPMSFFGIVGPSNLPTEVAEKLSKTVMSVASDLKFRQQMVGVGGLGDPLGPEDFKKFIVDDLTQWRNVIAAARIEQID
jgi:tripartite-type tricarboxylate transporter receptor subunit TctC